MNAAAAGKAIEEAYLNNLRRDFPGDPTDITDFPVQQRAACLINWQSDTDGRLAK